MSDAFERIVDLVASEGKAVLSRALRQGGIIAGLFAEESTASSFTLHAPRSLHAPRARETKHARHAEPGPDTGRTQHAYRTGRTAPVVGCQRQRRAGAGIHLFDAERSTYAATDDPSGRSLLATADEAAASFRSSAAPPPVVQESLSTFSDLPQDALDRASDIEVRALLDRASDAALSLLPDACDVHVDLQGRSTRFVAASSDGRFVRSARSTMNLRVRLRGRDGREAYAVGGGAGGLGLFHTHRPEDIAREAGARLAALADHAEGPSIAGEHAVVIGGGWGGVWLHEVVGHSLEADVGVYGRDRIGERVSGDSVNVIDDTQMEGGRGHAPVDDEGSPGQRTVLIDEGILTGVLTDRASALRYGLPETGNGRRQDYRHVPLPRMTNLALAPGPASPDDLVEAAGRGLYVKMVGSGRVVPARDTFSFDVLEGYLIENGHLGPAVSGLRIHGRLSEMLRRIAGIANDFRLDPGRGTCDKKGQVVPVSVGMPTILVNQMTISPAG